MTAACARATCWGHQHRQPPHHGADPGASAHNQTRLQILGGYFTHKEQEQALRQRKQECREQLDKLQDLLLKLLQLPSDKRNPQTLQKIKLIRTQRLEESKLLDEQLEAAQEELQKLMAEMDIIATQHAFPGSRWRWPTTTTGSTSSTAPSTSPSVKISCS